MGGNQSAAAATEEEARAMEAEIRDQILAQGLTPTSPHQYQVQITVGGLTGDAGPEGTIYVDVHPSWSPRGEARFRALLEAGWFDGCKFFRVLPGFMVQFGLAADPAPMKRKVSRPAS